jgi:hypothetical protein
MYLLHTFFLNYKLHSLLALFVFYDFAASDQVEGLADKVTWREVVTFIRD